MGLDVRTYEEDRLENSSSHEFYLRHFNPFVSHRMEETFGTTNLFEIYEREIGVVLHGDPRSDEAYFEYLEPNSSEQE